ncbi:hypothetical protein [Thalassococcus sp. S3]|uniref:hypothetical protein n=1 Tax=Thalassococcus sp. S3 TaxID=2017482 RepID=UPI0010241A4F|nr:hypothetical protein [Thalassococcus sp. S3]QBF34268.1 hypothetical protein CFI11_24080 [Thalassococcus sp. S3]
MTLTPTVTEEEAATKERRDIARLIAWGTWLTEFKMSNPDATEAERKASWEAVRSDRMKGGFRALESLERGNFKVVPAE